MKKLENIDYWIFDLDGTLYPRQKINEEIDVKTVEFLQKKFNLTREEANKEKSLKYSSYNIAVQTLVNSDTPELAREFHYFVKEIYQRNLSQDTGLNDALSKLSGKKYILTTTEKGYAEELLKGMGILQHFEKIYGPKETNYIIKPNAEAYLKVIKDNNIDIEKTVMIEDSFNNIIGAKKIGLKTIFIDNFNNRSNINMDFVDIYSIDLVNTLQSLLS